MKIVYAFLALIVAAVTVRAAMGAAATASPAPKASPVAVTIAGFAFNPSSVTVPAGTTVKWVNKDQVSHTATSTGKVPEAFDSGNLDTNQTWAHTFTKPGTYTYVCNYHPNMRGTIVVSAPPTQTTTQ